MLVGFIYTELTLKVARNCSQAPFSDSVSVDIDSRVMYINSVNGRFQGSQILRTPNLSAVLGSNGVIRIWPMSHPVFTRNLGQILPANKAGDTQIDVAERAWFGQSIA